MNNKGQISLEYILVVIVVMLISISTINVIMDENEKNIILEAAQIGAKEGSNKNLYAMYYNDTFAEYQQENLNLLTPTDIEILEIKAKQTNDNTIKLKTTAHTSKILTNEEKSRMSSRINYYIRKSITETFNQKTNDSFYTIANSNRYNIETEEVKWI